MANANYLRSRCIAVGALLAGWGVATLAGESCPQDEVADHVVQQFHEYGPRSVQREYFGFIYLEGREVKSSVVRGAACRSQDGCTIDPTRAARALPRGAKVLGEWHTHPGKLGANSISVLDVRGARNNHHIRCYMAYYAASDGNFYSWDPASSSVPVAMNSRVLLGNYRKPESVPAIIAAHHDPGSKCLSTNTNVPAADTATRSCRRSATSR